MLDELDIAIEAIKIEWVEYFKNYMLRLVEQDPERFEKYKDFMEEWHNYVS